MNRMAATAMIGIVLSGVASAQIVVNSDITTSTTWTSNNVYDLQAQVRVRNGATLTIQPGTVIASSSTANDSSLIVTRQGTIMALGTKGNPIIFTSDDDRATWTGGDPKTGAWRGVASEWGNVTIMGEAYMNDFNVVGNVSGFNASNFGNMEGLTVDPLHQYGGGNDNDDSGTFKYVSLRYGGFTLAPAVELNGLSLGAVGRGTDIHHVDVMNNRDDGIEIWGGTVNLKYLNIWNVGDDSLDIDQGYRGKIQFGLIVQGNSDHGSQGSGTGDNCFEIDGAEDCFWQPVTTTSIYNVTAIGMPDSPAAGRFGCDEGTTWRASARVQYRNCIWMDLGEELIQVDATDGAPDNSCAYGSNGTLTWAQTWTTAYNGAIGTDPNDPPGEAAFYQTQVDGNLSEITDSVFYNNDDVTAPTAYAEATTVGVVPGTGANDNVVEPANIPIRGITRDANDDYSTFRMNRVIGLDPRANNNAAFSADSAPADGFFSAARFRGGFHPCKNYWVVGWTAADAFGFLDHSKVTCADI